MNINRQIFFTGYRKAFGKLTQPQVDALEALLYSIQEDEGIEAAGMDARHIAYILATIKHETANTFEPIEEYGKGFGKPYGKKDRVTGEAYFGRGYVQLTWKKNYEKFSKLLGVDLVRKPELALDPQTAWQITSIGMIEGLYTGKKLFDYINEDDCDYYNARRIVNGTDKAQLISSFAERFARIIDETPELPQETPTDESESDSTFQPKPTPEKPDAPQPNPPNEPAKGSYLDEPIKIVKDNSGKLANWMVGAAASSTAAGFWQKNQTLIVVGLIILAVMVLAIYLVNRSMKLFEAKTAASRDLNQVQFVKGSQLTQSETSIGSGPHR